MQSFTRRLLTRQRGPESWTSCQEGFLHFPFHHLVSFHLLEVSQKLQAPPQNYFQHPPSFAPWGFGRLEVVAVVRSFPLPPLGLEKVRGTPQQSRGSSSCAMTPKMTWMRMLQSWRKSLTTWRSTNWRNLICDSWTHASMMRRMNWSLTWTWRIPSPWATWIPTWSAWRVTCPSSPPCCSPPFSLGRENSFGGLETCSPPRQSKIRYNYFFTDFYCN